MGGVDGYPRFVQVPYGSMNMQGMSSNQQYYMMPAQVPMYPLYGFQPVAQSRFYDPNGPVNLAGASFYDPPPDKDSHAEKKKK
jgi:hypothetical protein